MTKMLAHKKLWESALYPLSIEYPIPVTSWSTCLVTTGSEFSVMINDIDPDELIHTSESDKHMYALFFALYFADAEKCIAGVGSIHDSNYYIEV